MRILITSEHEFTGARLDVGKYYNAEPACEGTDAQRRAYFALIDEYWKSGCYSYNVKSKKEFHEAIKYYLGSGIEEYTNFIKDGKWCEGYTDYRIKSFSNYTKRERQNIIGSLIREMIEAGVSSRQFEEILRGLEKNGF